MAAQNITCDVEEVKGDQVNEAIVSSFCHTAASIQVAAGHLSMLQVQALHAVHWQRLLRAYAIIFHWISYDA